MTGAEPARALNLSWQPEERDWAEAFDARNRARRSWLKVWGLAGLAVVAALVLLAAGAGSGLAVACLVYAVGLPLLVLAAQPLKVRAFWRRNPVLWQPPGLWTAG